MAAAATAAAALSSGCVCTFIQPQNVCLYLHTKRSWRGSGGGGGLRGRLAYVAQNVQHGNRVSSCPRSQARAHARAAPRPLAVRPYAFKGFCRTRSDVCARKHARMHARTRARAPYMYMHADMYRHSPSCCAAPAPSSWKRGRPARPNANATRQFLRIWAAGRKAIRLHLCEKHIMYACEIGGAVCRSVCSGSSRCAGAGDAANISPAPFVGRYGNGPAKSSET